MMVSVRSSLLPLGMAVAVAPFGCPDAAIGQWSASDVVSIDNVERSVEAQYEVILDSDASSGTSVSSWNGSAFATRGIAAFVRQYASADQSFVVDADGVSGSAENAVALLRGMSGAGSSSIVARSSSTLMIEFTVDSSLVRIDRSLPDSSWSYSGSSPLEKLLMDSRGIALEEAPLVRASLSCSILTSHAIKKMPFTKFNPLAAGFVPNSRRKGAIGTRLWRVDALGVAEAIEFNAVTSARLSDKKLEYELIVDLAPGHYVLEVESGLEVKKRSSVTYTAELDMDLAFEYTGPGAIEPTIDAFKRELDVSANGTSQNWSTSDQFDDDWEWLRVGSHSTMAQAGSVAVFEPAGWYGYMHARSKHPVSLTAGNSIAANEIEVEFTLDEASDVGVALLMDFWQRSTSGNVNWNWCDLEIKDAATGHQKLGLMHGGLGTTSFDEDRAWVTLPAGTYTLRIATGSTCWDQSIERGEDETAVWFALLFE